MSLRKYRDIPLRRLLLFLAILCAPAAFAGTCTGTVPSGVTQCYYVDYASGSDSNTGADKSHPWKLAPGMNGFAGSYTSAAGDGIIFKGGVSWSMDVIAGGCWYWGWSGSSPHEIYLGVDSSWYTGGSWSRPILTANGNPILPVNNTSTCASTNPATAPSGNDMLQLDANYVQVDNIEFTGMQFGDSITGATCGGYCNYFFFVLPNSRHDIQISNDYCHGWSNVGGNSTTINNDTGGCFVNNSQGGANHYPDANTIADHIVVDGSDTSYVTADPNCLYQCFATTAGISGYWSDVRYSIIRYTAQGFDGVWGGGAFHDNIIEYVRRSINLSSGNHANGFQSQQSNGGNFYNNIIRHTFLAAYPTDSYTTLGLPTDATYTTYVFNILVYDTGTANCFDVAYLDAVNSTPLGTQNVFNSTVECGPDPSSKLTFAGTVTVSGAAVTWATGDKFPFGLDPSANAGGGGGTITLNGTPCTVLSVSSATSITLTTSCGSSGSWTAYGTTAANATPINGTPAAPGNFCGASPCYTALNVDNNHWITSAPAYSNCTNTGGATCNYGTHNILQSWTTANGQGYNISEMYAFSPTAGGNATVGAGTNETSGWPMGISTNDTTYSCTYNTSNHTMNYPARTTNTRPSSGAWDSGAYEYGSAPPSVPNPPTGTSSSNGGSVGAHTVIITWNPPTIGSGLTYYIFRGFSSGGEGSTPINSSGVGLNCTGPSGGCSYTDSTVLAGMNLYYFVESYNGSYSVPSNETNSQVPVVAPTGLTIISTH